MTGGGSPWGRCYIGISQEFQPSDPKEETHRMSDFFVFQRKTCCTSAGLFLSICLDARTWPGRVLTHFSVHDYVPFFLIEHLLFRVLF